MPRQQASLGSAERSLQCPAFEYCAVDVLNRLDCFPAIGVRHVYRIRRPAPSAAKSIQIFRHAFAPAGHTRGSSFSTHQNAAGDLTLTTFKRSRRDRT